MAAREGQAAGFDGRIGALILPMDAEKRWAFKTPQNDSLMADAIAEYMAKHGVKTVGFIGFADAYGDGWLAEFERAAKANNDPRSSTTSAMPAPTPP